jgi:thiaminase
MSTFPTITSHLLTLHPDNFTRATQSPFLAAAANGTLSNPTISHWLANDRLYMQGYIALSGSILRMLPLPAKPTPSTAAGTIEVRLLDWLVDALVNIRREERFFMDVAERYGLEVDISDEYGVVCEDRKIEGLKKFEALFSELTNPQRQAPTLLPWLEGAILFWATEKVYFTAWTWAKEQAERRDSSRVEHDADGGAMRKEFIPNWTSEEFVEFVDKLERIVDEGVEGAVGGDEGKWREVRARSEGVWARLLACEEEFWPVV